MKTNSLESFRTAHNQGRIVREGARIDMEVEGATFASWHPEKLLTGYSWDALSAAALLHPSGKPRDVLLLGLAGGTMVRILNHLLPSARITAVELDGELVHVAVDKMHLEVNGLNLHIGDAYAFLDETRKRFDVILDDVYLSGKTDVYRPETVDAGIVERYRRAMKKNGIVAINMITDKPHRPLLRKTVSALTTAFSRHAAITAPRGFNQAVVAGNRLREVSEIRRMEHTFANESDRTLWRRMKLAADSGAST